ncbi:MAG: translocation/assembly module TamB [Candidatus Azobacteroides sp.]|nr:translocation/assembly module TamB [Candidatus Azobacteroides sp.]
MKKTNNKISIGALRFRPFNRLQLEEIYAADLKNDTLLYAKKLNAAFDLFKLMRKQFVIRSVEAENFDLHISQDSTNAPFNFQFLIDAFASDTTQSADNSNLQLTVDHILLKNGHLRYDVLSEPAQAAGLFDVNHAEIRNLQLDAKLYLNNSEDWNGSIENLSFDEKCGFALKQMKFQIKNLNSRLQADRFYVSLPHSEIEIKEANLDYTGFQPSEILSGAAYSLLLSSVKCDLRDFACFYPKLAEYTDILTCSGEIKGTFPEISIPHLELNYGTQLQLALSAGIADYNAWETSDFTLDVKKCLVDPEPFGLPIHAEPITLNGKITGSLPDLKLDLTAQSEQGDWTLNGTGGYDVSSENIRFDLNMESSEYNLKSLLSDSTLGNVSFRLATQGTIAALNKVDAKADAEIRRFDYLGYSYRNITANATYGNDNVSINLTGEDPNLPLKIHGKAGLNKENTFVQLYAKLDGVRPDSLNLLPQYPGSTLSGILNADIKGFDPERMTASVVIENLHLSTSAGAFTDSPITFSYSAGADRQKQINLRSSTLNVRGKGNFTYEGIAQSISRAFPGLFPSGNRKTTSDRDNFDFLVGIRHANEIARLLELETAIPDSALFVGKYIGEDENLNLNVTAYCIFTESDTARVNLDLSNEQHNLIARLDLKNKSNQYELEGNMGATVEFIPTSNLTKPNMNIALNPGSLTLNGTAFHIHSAQIIVTNNKYEINDFALQHSSSEYLKVNGILSDNTKDSLQVTINHFEIGTFLSALKNKIPLSGTASGDITLSRLMTNPLILTRNFTIDSMVFDKNPIGDLQVRSVWNSERQGLVLRAAWNHPNAPESLISGLVLPKKDSLILTANIQGIQLNWLSGYLPDNLSGLTGELGMQIKAAGKLDEPILTGTIYLNDASVGIPMLNTRYRTSDSIFLEKDQIVFRDCIVYDETNQNVKINGSIKHNRFSAFNPKLTLDFNRFLVLNNSEQTDSLFYGLIRVSGNLNVFLQNKDWIVQGKLSNEKANKMMLNLPSSLEAERYNWLTFVNTPKKDSPAVVKKQVESELSAFSFPMKFRITLSVNPELSVGTIINPDTKDAAIVTGSGVLDLSYSLDNPVPSLLGNYVINDGKCTLSLKGITKKTFSVQPGGKLNFQGDLMNTTFDLTAIYSLRAYLTSLDPSFASMATASRIPVNCLLTANGKLEDMRLIYRIELPDQTNEIQRKMDGLIYSDEIKIKEIAYLLAFGSFMPINSGSTNTGNSSLWTSLASSSITTQLNNLLSGVLSDNWTIGTDLHSNDANFSNVDMDVNISTRMFDDRLTINSTLGYHNNTAQTNNFTGDFNIEYKLTPRGNVLLQFYNVTNNQYYDKSRSPLTQGAGIVYKREARTFRQLFRSLRLKKRTTDNR